MLEITIGKGFGVNIKATGETGELLTELAVATNILYRQMVGDDEEMAKDIKMLIQMAILDDDSPYWKDLDIGEGSTAIRVEIPNQ